MQPVTFFHHGFNFVIRVFKIKKLLPGQLHWENLQGMGPEGPGMAATGKRGWVPSSPRSCGRGSRASRSGGCSASQTRGGAWREQLHGKTEAAAGEGAGLQEFYSWLKIMVYILHFIYIYAHIYIYIYIYIFRRVSWWQRMQRRQSYWMSSLLQSSVLRLALRNPRPRR